MAASAYVCVQLEAGLGLTGQGDYITGVMWKTILYTAGTQYSGSNANKDLMFLFSALGSTLVLAHAWALPASLLQHAVVSIPP